jgi:NAD/NADP transhydrogenase beta subunit
MQQAKTFALAGCAPLAVIVAIQNTETVETRLLIITLLVGAAVGLVIGTRLSPHEKPKESWHKLNTIEHNQAIQRKNRMQRQAHRH